MLADIVVREAFVIMMSLLAVFVLLYVLAKLGQKNRYDVYLTMISENRIILIVNHSRKIEAFSDRFKKLFPDVQKSLKLDDFLNMQHCFGSYVLGTEFVVVLNGVRYRAVSSTFNNMEIIELENISEYLEMSIRQLFLDFEKSPISFVADMEGNILSISVNFNKYWRLFDVKRFNHLRDIGIFDRDFVFDVMHDDYLNGSMTVDIDGVEIFMVHSHKIDDQNIVVHLSLKGENAYFSSGQYDVLGALINALDDGLVAIDNDGKITSVNKKMLKLVGRDTLIGEDVLSVFNLYDKDNRRVSLTLPLEARVYEYAWFESPYSDTRLVVELIISEVLEHDRFRTGYVLNFRDTSLRQSIAMKSYRFAYRDALTGAFNRHYLKEIVSEIGESVSQFGVMLLDCNSLKVINDSFGHDLGDKMIQTTARVLLNNKRNQDSVIRMGGDEFAILLPNIDEASFKDFMDNIRKDILKTQVEGLPLSVSLGGEYHHDGPFSFVDKLAKAELKMYRDKMLSGRIARDNIMNHILKKITDRNPWEKEHSDLVSYLSREIAIEMNLGEELIHLIANAGKYHSIGKVNLSQEVQLAGGDSPKHGAAYRVHTESAFRILSSMPEYSYLANAVLLYKENYDGSGLPHGLQRHDIPISSRILRVASSTSKLLNPMDQTITAKNRSEVMDIMHGNAGKLYDPSVVDHLEIVMENKDLKEKLD